MDPTEIVPTQLLFYLAIIGAASFVVMDSLKKLRDFLNKKYNFNHSAQWKNYWLPMLPPVVGTVIALALVKFGAWNIHWLVAVLAGAVAGHSDSLIYRLWKSVLKSKAEKEKTS